MCRRRRRAPAESLTGADRPPVPAHASSIASPAHCVAFGRQYSSTTMNDAYNNTINKTTRNDARKKKKKNKQSNKQTKKNQVTP
jgi:hypothetical protein